MGPAAVFCVDRFSFNLQPENFGFGRHSWWRLGGANDFWMDCGGCVSGSGNLLTCALVPGRPSAASDRDRDNFGLLGGTHTGGLRASILEVIRVRNHPQLAKSKATLLHANFSR